MTVCGVGRSRCLTSSSPLLSVVRSRWNRSGSADQSVVTPWSVSRCGAGRSYATPEGSVDELPLQNRWILVEFLALPYPNRQSTGLSSKQIYPALKQSVIVNFGDTGWGAVGGSLNGTTLVYAGRNANGTDAVKYFSPATNICIIRVARDPYRIAWGAVTYLSSIDGQKYIPNVVHVSGQCTLSRSSTAPHSGHQGQSNTPSSPP